MVPSIAVTQTFFFFVDRSMFFLLNLFELTFFTFVCMYLARGVLLTTVVVPLQWVPLVAACFKVLKVLEMHQPYVLL